MQLFAPYLAVVSARYRMLLQYRVAALAGFVTQFFWGSVRLMILAAFYAAADGTEPITLPQVVAYVWLGQALLGLLPWNIDQEIGNQVRTGGVAYELLRPLDLYAFWYMRTLAFRTATTTLRMIPLLLFAGLMLPLLGFEQWALPPPPTLAAAVAFVCSIAAMAVLATAITMLMHISLMWTVSGEGFNRMMPGLVSILSGLLVPLPLYPLWLQPFLDWQPFRGVGDVPFRLYTGNIPASSAAGEVLFQLGWTVAIVVLGYLLLGVGRRRLVVQGG